MSKEINIETIKEILPKRSNNSNKSTFGKVLNVAGSKNYTGAAYLSSIAALCVGAGYVSLASSYRIVEKISIMSCDLTYFELKKFNNLKKTFETLQNYDAFSIGCGLSQDNFAKKVVKDFLTVFKNSDKGFVFDADALNIISKLKDVTLPKNSILTPHPKELSRLIGSGVEEILNNREYFVAQAADKFNCTVVLKGHQSLICNNDGEIFVNNSGSSVLSKAGSGDVLTGMIAGFLAQGTSCENAAKLGVYLHGLAGDLYTKDFSQYSMLASNLTKYIKFAIKKILN